jgi:UDP-N-acetylmuramate dehydrogenase
MHIARNVSLASHTTFALGGPARYFVSVHGEQELRDALAFARELRLPVCVLGGGSNLVVADRGFDGLVVHLRSRGVHTVKKGALTLLEVEAGEAWDPFVERTVDAGLAGLECLSGIPGSVGATPIQNVGAYGQEVAQTIVSVRTIDAETGEVRTRLPAQCGFRYRHSVFKEPSAKGEIVTRVTFGLSHGAPIIRYPELERALHGQPPTLSSVRAKVIELRRSKSMVFDPTDDNRHSAGSFFTNPIVSTATADEVAARAVADGIIAVPKEMPRFPEGERVKLSAGWLIERAGMAKGTRRGNVGISSKHALALVHHGGGTTTELVALAREVVAAVRTRFGVTLAPEPVLLGFRDGEGVCDRRGDLPSPRRRSRDRWRTPCRPLRGSPRWWRDRRSTRRRGRGGAPARRAASVA